MKPKPLDDYISRQLNSHLDEIEKILNSDGISITGPIFYGLDSKVRDVLEFIKEKKDNLTVILDTAGGIVEVVERLVNCIRYFYKEVIFIIPDKAMSAGTIFALSGDRILMDYYSCLGPIDPQFLKGDQFIPALSYLNQFEKLNKKAQDGTLTSAEYALLSKLDLGELYQYEQAKELSCELLVEWLIKYKFKNWERTEATQTEVTKEKKKTVATNIAKLLSNTERWHTHGRNINKLILIDEIKLKIEDYSEIEKLGPAVREYSELLKDYRSREGSTSFFVHSKDYF